MKRIKVFIFIPSLVGGGAERVSSRIASCLNPELFDTMLVVGKKEGEYVSQLPPTLAVRDLNKKRVRSCIIPLARLFRQEKPDVVISFMHHSNIAVLMAKVLSISKVKVITAERNVMESAYKGFRRFFLPLTRLLYRFSDASLAGSEGLKKNIMEFLHISEEKFRVIYNPIDFGFIRTKSRERPNHPWLRSKEHPLVLGVGRLVPQKDFATLIRAFARAKKPKDTRLIILGQGPLREELLGLAKELGIADSVDFPGFQENPYVFFANADVFVLSSIWEGFGNVIPESFALRVPVVSTDCNYGPNEIIENEANGILVPPGDPEVMAKGIERMLNDRKFGTQCAANAQKDAERLSIEKITDQYQDFILSVIKKK
ncbi:MAG: glycosyltransferase [Candidatus Colwellbacteria bacterium]|nr:glycosyltransferase [Candidatus Colwellbacteria bacterium]